MKYTATGIRERPMLVSMRCPACRQQGTFEHFALDDVTAEEEVVLGQRHCPNPSCRAHVFVVLHHATGKRIASFPPELIDFDSSNLPTGVVKALEEAVTCHANECYTAAAIMVRKTLEELCRDRGASGGNLKDRVRDLGSKVVLPKELLDGLDDIRLLGNDAAHIEAQVYEQVGQDEVEIGIEFAKEVLKAVYQYQALLDRLRSLKRPAS
jgi:Domain of unknown function (DUF4145)